MQFFLLGLSLFVGFDNPEATTLSFDVPGLEGLNVRLLTILILLALALLSYNSATSLSLSYESRSKNEMHYILMYMSFMLL